MTSSVNDIEISLKIGKAHMNKEEGHDSLLLFASNELNGHFSCLRSSKYQIFPNMEDKVNWCLQILSVFYKYFSSGEKL